MRFDVITLFPDFIESCARIGVVGRARERGLLEVATWNPRDFATDNYRSADDRCYGGGPGMVMMIDPLRRALDSARAAGESGGEAKVVYLSPQGARLDQAKVVELAQHADCLLAMCPLTPQTTGIVDARVLDALGPEGYLVNVARGPVVVERDLIAALREKRIAGAALDVFWDEPCMPAELAAMDNVVLTPHLGSTVREIREERGRKMLANVRAFFEGKPVPNPVE